MVSAFFCKKEKWQINIQQLSLLLNQNRNIVYTSWQSTSNFKGFQMNYNHGTLDQVSNVDIIWNLVGFWEDERKMVIGREKWSVVERGQACVARRQWHLHDIPEEEMMTLHNLRCVLHATCTDLSSWMDLTRSIKIVYFKAFNFQ